MGNILGSVGRKILSILGSGGLIMIKIQTCSYTYTLYMCSRIKLQRTFITTNWLYICTCELKLGKLNFNYRKINVRLGLK